MVYFWPKGFLCLQDFINLINMLTFKQYKNFEQIIYLSMWTKILDEIKHNKCFSAISMQYTNGRHVCSKTKQKQRTERKLQNDSLIV